MVYKPPALIILYAQSFQTAQCKVNVIPQNGGWSILQSLFRLPLIASLDVSVVGKVNTILNTYKPQLRISGAESYLFLAIVKTLVKRYLRERKVKQKI